MDASIPSSTVNPMQSELFAQMELAGGMRMSKWCKIVGISRTSAWRLRKSGRPPVVMRYGVPFLTADTIKRFFSDDGSTPRMPGVKAV